MPTIEELQAEVAALKAEKAKQNQIKFKVGDKGGVSVYGLGRFPVTLYYEQWLRLLDSANKSAELIITARDGTDFYIRSKDILAI